MSKEMSALSACPEHEGLALQMLGKFHFISQEHKQCNFLKWLKKISDKNYLSLSLAVK